MITKPTNQDLSSITPGNLQQTIDQVKPEFTMRIQDLASRIGAPLDINTLKPAQIIGLKEFASLPVQNAGIFDTPQNGFAPGNLTKDGKRTFVNPELLNKSGFPEMGQEQLQSLGMVFDTLGAFSDEEEAMKFDNLVKTVSNKDVLTQITNMKASGDEKNAVANVMQLIGAGTPQENLPAAISALNTLDSWDDMTDTQQSLALAGLATTNFKFKDGAALTDKIIATTKEGKPLTTGAALSFMQSGVNVPELMQNWDTIDAVQRMTFGPGSPSQMVATAQRMGMLNKLDAQGLTEEGLGAAGFVSAASAGIGAITGPADKLPQGYKVAKQNPDGTVLAVPEGLESTVAIHAGAADISTLADDQITGVARTAMRIVNQWTPGAPIDKVRGGTGNAQVLKSLNKLTQEDPYIASAIVANSTLGNVVKSRVAPTQQQPQQPTQNSLLRSTGAGAMPPEQARQAARNDDILNQSIPLVQSVITTIAAGSQMVGATGTAQTAGQAGSAVGLIAAGKQLYDVMNNPDATDKQKAEAIAAATQSGVNAAASAGSQLAGSVAPGINVALAAYNASQIMSSDMTPEQKAKALERTAEDTAAAIYTMGLSSVVQFLDRQFLGGQIDKLRDRQDKLMESDIAKVLMPGMYFTNKGINKVMVSAMGAMEGKSQDQKMRDMVREGAQKTGLLNDKFQIQLADGSMADMGMDGKGGRHSFRFPEKIPAGAENRELNAYDVDYTNDLDYAASMGAMALSRLLVGGKGKQVDQFGGQLANAAISSVGFGKDMTEENYATVMANIRGFYAKSGITKKEDMYAMANEAFAQGRLSEFDYIQMKQSADMVFEENSFDMASTLMEGRWKGLEVAAQTEKAPGPNIEFKPAAIRSPEQAQASVDAVSQIDTSVIQQPEVAWDSGNFWGIKNAGAIPKLYSPKEQTTRTKSISAKDMTREEIAKLNRARAL